MLEKMKVLEVKDIDLALGIIFSEKLQSYRYCLQCNIYIYLQCSKAREIPHIILRQYRFCTVSNISKIGYGF